MSKPFGTNGKVFDDHPRLKRLHEYVEQKLLLLYSPMDFYDDNQEWS